MMIWFCYFLMTMLMLSGLFLIGLILLQRGRGGGLAGAFGGMGGQSAFGTKAGDVFTRITIGVAAAWILLCAGSVVALHNSSGGRITAVAPPDAEKTDPVKADPKTDKTDESDDLRLPADVNPPSDQAKGVDKKTSGVDAEKPAGNSSAEKQTPPEKPSVPAAPTDPAPDAPKTDEAKSDAIEGGEKKSAPESTADEKPKQ